MTDALMLYEVDAGVAVVTLNNPSALNALSIPMVEQAIALLDRAERDARAVVLTGAGRGFCSGADLSSAEFDPATPGYDAGAYLESHYNPLILKIRGLAPPVVAAVNGAAAGVGFPLAAVCDYIVAAKSSYFLQAFRSIGLVPDGGSAFLLAQTVGRVRASEMMMLGEKISAEEALRLGIINAVVHDGEALMQAKLVARRIADGPAGAIQMMKRLAWAGLEAGLDEVMAMERACQLDAGRRPDHIEGVDAFLQKRKPHFNRGWPEAK